MLIDVTMSILHWACIFSSLMMIMKYDALGIAIASFAINLDLDAVTRRDNRQSRCSI